MCTEIYTDFDAFYVKENIVRRQDVKQPKYEKISLRIVITFLVI